MAWIGIITNNGNDLLTRWVEGKQLTITRAAAGQGRVDPAAMLAQADLVNEKLNPYQKEVTVVDLAIRAG